MHVEYLIKSVSLYENMYNAYYECARLDNEYYFSIQNSYKENVLNFWCFGQVQSLGFFELPKSKNNLL